MYAYNYPASGLTRICFCSRTSSAVKYLYSTFSLSLFTLCHLGSDGPAISLLDLLCWAETGSEAGAVFFSFPYRPVTYDQNIR